MAGGSLLLAACFVAPLRVRQELEVTVVDDPTGAPIAGAEVLYISCDIHDFDCSGADLFRTRTDSHGRVRIRARRSWGPWYPAPGGLPIPRRIVAIWSPEHAAFVYWDYGDSFEAATRRMARDDLRVALDEIPEERIASVDRFDPEDVLRGGTIRLGAAGPQ